MENANQEVVNLNANQEVVSLNANQEVVSLNPVTGDERIDPMSHLFVVKLDCLTRPSIPN